MPDKKTPHVHAEFIKAWADGATIQVCDLCGEWRDVAYPMWDVHLAHRIKPVRREDLVMVGVVAPLFPGDGSPKTSCWYVLPCADVHHNLKLTFDGETGKLKDAQVLATE